MKKILLSCLLASSLFGLYSCTPTSEPTVESSELAGNTDPPSDVTGSTEYSNSEASASDGYARPTTSGKPKVLLIGPIVDSSEDCGSFNTQTEMNMCAKRNADAASAQLEYVKSFITESLTDTARTSLASSESAWMRFRDLDCGFARDQFTGGSMAPLIYGDCLSNRNLSRTRELAGEGQTSLGYAEADAQLNENYQSLMDVVGGPRADALVDVQLAWIEYRDRNCAYEVTHSLTFDGTEDQCLARMSETRAVDLEQAAEQNSL